MEMGQGQKGSQRSWKEPVCRETFRNGEQVEYRQLEINKKIKNSRMDLRAGSETNLQKRDSNRNDDMLVRPRRSVFRFVCMDERRGIDMQQESVSNL